MTNEEIDIDSELARVQRVFDCGSAIACDTCGKCWPDDHASDSESCDCGRFKQRMGWAKPDDIAADKRYADALRALREAMRERDESNANKSLARMVAEAWQKRAEAAEQRLEQAERERNKREGGGERQVSPLDCTGCGLPESHKKCPAHGTDIYMNPEHGCYGNAADIAYAQQRRAESAERRLAEREAVLVRLGKAVLAGGPPDDIGPPAEVWEEYYAASDAVKALAVQLAERKEGE